MLTIVLDGAADVAKGWEQEFDLHLLPLRVSFGNESFTQGPDFTHSDFYRMVQEKRIIPKSTLPSLGQVVDFYRNIARPGEQILSIHISNKLSGTLATVQLAARELADEFKITVFDSGGGSAMQGFMAREARRMEQAGMGLEEITRCLDGLRERFTVIFTLDTLQFAYLSGRVNFAQSLLSMALQVKPIIVLRAGLLELSGRVRTRRRALDRVLEMVCERLGSHPANLAVIHAADPEMAHSMVTSARSLLNIKEAFINDLSIPVAANLGPGAIGIVAYPVEEE
jgi:DegV family protein with EDD domain